MNNRANTHSTIFISKHIILFAVLTFSTIGIFIASLLIGTVDISAKQLLHVLWVQDDSLVSNVVLELRLPRTVVGFMVGAMLALAGALMQVLLRNPVAEPYILGVSGGASVAVLTAMLLGLSGFWISGSVRFGTWERRLESCTFVIDRHCHCRRMGCTDQFDSIYHTGSATSKYVVLVDGGFKLCDLL